MTPPSTNKEGSLKTIGTPILIVIICLVIVVVALGTFFAHPQQQIPSSNISLAPTITPITVPTTPITPFTGASGTTVPVTISGTNFPYGPSPTIWLTKMGEPDIIATDVAVISPTQITCTFPLPKSTSSGQWDIFMRKAGEQSGSKVGVFTVVNKISSTLTWNWSDDGWDDWQHDASCSGTTGTETGSCLEYGPVIADGLGEYGSNVTLDRVPTESGVSKTFTAPSGAQWNTLTFNGLLSPSPIPFARWMAIDVNGERVFYADATQTPPGNGQKFSITRSFTPANSVHIKISAGQDPTWGTSLYTLQFNSLTLS